MTILLLHGNNLDDAFLALAALSYLAIMFILAQIRTRRLKKEKLRRKQERLAAIARQDNTPENPKSNI
jgi:hypothetical protein